MRWLPIESAPRDGTDILIAGGTYSAYDHNDLPAGRMVSIAYWDKSMGGHWHGDEANAHDEWHVHKPTHWMPLPPPPTDEHDGLGITNNPTPDAPEPLNDQEI